MSYALSLLALIPFVLSFGALATGRPVLWLELVVVAGLLVSEAGRGLA